MREINLGPVANPDGTPSLVSLEMLNRPRYDHLVHRAHEYVDRKPERYPAFYRIDEMIAEDVDRGIITKEEAAWLSELVDTIKAKNAETTS